jgi:hypothetical protein
MLLQALHLHNFQGELLVKIIEDYLRGMYGVENHLETIFSFLFHIPDVMWLHHDLDPADFFLHQVNDLNHSMDIWIG